jgi:hypothetical protein
MIHVMTPTGARPEAFAACVAQMRMQDCGGPVQWIIVDDGPEPMPTPQVDGWDVLHIRREPHWQPGENTLAANLLCGLSALPKAARVVVIEDDDQYAPWWLSRCDEWLEMADLVGESHALYRNVVTGAEKAMGNDRHASLCSTAIKGPALDALRHSAEQGALGIDLRLWRDFEGSKALYPPEPRGVTGLKCWPGRAGIGIGHRL